MSRMIDDLLDLARARLAGGIAVHREPLDLGSRRRARRAECRSSSPERAHRVAQDGDCSGEWDADRLAQVASNLIGNALRHGDAEPAGPRRARRQRAAEVVLSVANAGAIPPEVLPHIFDPFRSGRPQPAPRDGLGLGLYIVQQIVLAHGGRIDVASDAGARHGVPRDAAAPAAAVRRAGTGRTRASPRG